MAEKVVVVTGANKGLGFAIVKLLLQQNSNWKVLLCSRNHERGQKAVDTLKTNLGLTAHLRILDIDSLESIQAFRDSLKQEFPDGIDMLINNAGIFLDIRDSTDENNFKFNVDNVRATIKTNFFGVYHVCQELIPLLKADGRVINVSSRLSQIIFMHCKPFRQAKIRDISTFEETVEMIKGFCDLDPAKYDEEGWIDQAPGQDCLPGYSLGLCLAYGVSKIGVNLLTKIYQTQFDKIAGSESRTISAMCPGDAATDMVPNAKNSAEFSADTVIYLALQPENERDRGVFLAERKKMDFFEMTSNEVEALLELM